jgi:hypothetical protein
MAYEASQQLADVARAEWQDYLARFKPIETALMNQTTYDNPDLFNQNIAQAQSAINTSMDTGAVNQNQLLQRYGVSQTADYATANSRLNDLNRQAALVDAANRIRQNLVDRNYQIATGSTMSAPVPISTQQANQQ